MARLETITLISDLDESVTADETVTFGLDGRGYQIDLSTEQAGLLRAALQPYVGAGRRASNGKATAKPARTTDAARNAEVRAWAVERGFELGNRGRIPAKILQAYAAERG